MATTMFRQVPVLMLSCRFPTHPVSSDATTNKIVSRLESDVPTIITIITRLLAVSIGNETLSKALSLALVDDMEAKENGICITKTELLWVYGYGTRVVRDGTPDGAVKCTGPSGRYAMMTTCWDHRSRGYTIRSSFPCKLHPTQRGRQHAVK